MKDALKDQIILITGAASGLGRAAAVQAAKQGASLSLVDLDEQGLRDTKKQVEDAVPGAEVIIATADVTNEDAVREYVENTVAKFGRIDGFYNNAGIEGKKAPTAEYDSDMFNKVIDVNIKGVFYGMKYVLRQMQKQGGGAIVNVASVGGIRGVQNECPYVASKHAVTGMTKCAAIEYGQYNIHVNAIAPGAILTNMVKESFKQDAGEDWEAVCEDFVSGNPMKRIGQPEEVANLVVFLLGRQSGFINGVVVPIDGGQSNEY